MTQLFLGVDGGQSSTTALIGDAEGRVLGAGCGGPCNHVGGPQGREKFVRAVTESVGQACRRAGADFETVQFEAACLGFSGGPADKEPILREMLRAAILNVSTDAPIALAGATAGRPGIIVIAGTGSIAFGRNAQGREMRAGGWGYLFGDEGGAFDITRQALRAALRCEEGWGPETALRERLLAATGSRSANDLLHRFYTTEFSRPQIAALARLADEAAGQGDGIALALLTKAGSELAALAEAVQAKLFEPGGEAPLVCYIGGVFRSRTVLAEFRTPLERRGIQVRPPLYGPAAGALLEAYRAGGLHPELTNVPVFKT